MLLAPEILPLLTEALPRAFNGAGLSETQFQSFYDTTAEPCRTPYLSPNMDLDTLDLNRCLGAQLDVDFATFCAAYDTYVEECIIGKSEAFRKPWEFFTQAFGLSDYDARFYFQSPRVAARYNRPLHERVNLMILAQFAVVNYGGEVIKQGGAAFVVQAHDRQFGLDAFLPVTIIPGAEKMALVQRAGISRYWQANPYEKAKPTLADSAYSIVANLEIAPAIKLPILEGISVMRWMTNRDTFHNMMLGVSTTPHLDAASRKAGKIRAIEQAMHFTWFQDVTAELRGLLQPSVVSYREFNALFGNKSYAKGSELSRTLIANWSNRLDELHQKVSNAK